MVIGIVKESFPGEARVAVVPSDLAALQKLGGRTLVETGAGIGAGYPDEAYLHAGAELCSRDAVLGAADVIPRVRFAGANGEDRTPWRPGQLVLGFADPLSHPDALARLAEAGVSAAAVELIPRISRAQAMDALSSMANLAGYKAVLLAASRMPKIFPMMMTAAGMVKPARVFVIGGGVAGLQAIATARRLGAVVQAYDVRAAVKEQVQSLGASFVEVPGAADGEDAGGYANEQADEALARQREAMLTVVKGSDAVITTAAIPGRPSPRLVTQAMVEAMAPGSVIVDLAAERGGNCELTRADQEVEHHGVLILGPTNLPATLPLHASQLYSRNLVTLLGTFIKDGAVHIDMEDEVTAGCLVTHQGRVVHPKIAALIAPTPQERAS